MWAAGLCGRIAQSVFWSRMGTSGSPQRGGNREVAWRSMNCEAEPIEDGVVTRSATGRGFARAVDSELDVLEL